MSHGTAEVMEARPAGDGARGRVLSTGIMLAACTALSVAALASRGTYALGAVSAGTMLLVMSCRVPYVLLLKGLRFFAWQSALLVALYLVRFGPSAGIAPGLAISWQLFMAFLPGVVFVGTTPQHRITALLARLLPYRTAFVISTSMKFVPRLVAEIREIHHMQVIRGARVSPGDIFKPSSWPDFVHCLFVPSVVKAISLAGEIALAATARDFGLAKRRTNWPGP